MKTFLVIDWVKVIYGLFIKAFKVFHQKRGTTLASSSTFYLLITIVPSLLLLIRGVGFFLGNLAQTQKYLFIIGSKFFPEVAPELLMKLQQMIRGPLFADTKFTVINFFILGISAITFLNSIWSGLYIITEDKLAISWSRIFKGFVIIGITIIAVMLLFIMPPIIIFVLKLLKNNFMMDFLYQTFDILRPFLKWIKTVDVRKTYWLRSSFLHSSLVFIYFTILYQWLFNWKLLWKEAILGAFTFALSVFIGKDLFWIYIYSVKKGMMSSYGELYSSILGLVWIFFLMCFFFYGACVCHVALRERWAND